MIIPTIKQDWAGMSSCQHSTHKFFNTPEDTRDWTLIKFQRSARLSLKGNGKEEILAEVKGKHHLRQKCFHSSA